MERPKVSKEMIAAAAEKLAGEISNIDDRDDFAKDLASCFRATKDGFQLGKALENKGYDVDTLMVEELDAMSDMVDSELLVAQWQWVLDFDIKPPFPVGTRITARRIGECEIDGISEHSPASYLAKPVGQDDELTGFRRYIIKFEDAIAV